MIPDENLLKETAMRNLIVTFALASTATGVFAAPETFNIEPAHTTLSFEYRQLGFSGQMRLFDKTNGRIVVDCAAKTGFVDVTIDAKSVNSGYPWLDEYLQDKDFFYSAKYPTITFKSRIMKFDCDKPGKIEGNLTVKGVTRPASLTVTSFRDTHGLMFKTESIGANAVAKFKRTEFDMGKYAPYISDEVTLVIGMKASSVSASARTLAARHRPNPASYTQD
jgi:polyisoprenoid-binding protein YceI